MARVQENAERAATQHAVSKEMTSLANPACFSGWFAARPRNGRCLPHGSARSNVSSGPASVNHVSRNMVVAAFRLTFVRSSIPVRMIAMATRRVSWRREAASLINQWWWYVSIALARMKSRTFQLCHPSTLSAVPSWCRVPGMRTTIQI
jgi:hypothetical protein